ncbi:hypothetical protein CWC25_10740 [Pseudoalteromonas sp. S4389]|uniref:TnsD family Tn7-like transposition protein n=1 Tax=Pseudoalteromonas sp. S4389 TaxID=579556 RepID=UPI001109FA34|nr:TnsD family Tn7-like transposition protein [Pseudoalteromonas sp. S4389]TMO43984.1 hypothetical protein CWC25_10740 [Pseudoalteromonas sp. S4389]
MQTLLSFYDDETVFSMIQRLAGYESKRNKMHCLDHIFGSCSIMFYSDFPSFIPRLSELLHLSPEKIICEHTILPACRLFIKPSKYQYIHTAMKSSKHVKVFVCQSMTGNKEYGKKVLYFCPMCARCDELEVGVAFWHVRHQLPGSFVCLKHKCLLHKQLVSKYSFNNWPEFSTCKVKPANDKSIKLAQFITYFHSRTNPLKHSFKELYILALKYRGLITENGSIRMKKLREQLIAYWKPIFDIDEVSNVFFQKKCELYPEAIFYRDKSEFTPLKQLLLMAYLFKSPHQIYCLDQQYDSLIADPGSSSLLKKILGSPDIIKELAERGYSISQIVNTTHLSISYIRKVVKKNNLNIKPKNHFMAKAEQRAIIFNLIIGRSTINIAKTFFRHERTIEKILRSRPDIVELRAKRRTYKKRKLERKALLLYLANNEAKSRRQIQVAIPSTYQWLYCNDKDWLYGQIPASRKVKP